MRPGPVEVSGTRIGVPAPCDRLARRLPVLVDDPDGLDRADRDHVDHCLRCQAAVAQHRRIRRTLHGLEAGDPVDDPDRVAVVLGALDARLARRRRVVRRSMALGLATATVIGVGAAAARRRRSA